MDVVATVADTGRTWRVLAVEPVSWNKQAFALAIDLGTTTIVNVIGLSIAAFGFLPLVLAAAAQSLPDIGIMANSARLIKQK